MKTTQVCKLCFGLSGFRLLWIISPPGSFSVEVVRAWLHPERVPVDCALEAGPASHGQFGNGKYWLLAEAWLLPSLPESSKLDTQEVWELIQAHSQRQAQIFFWKYHKRPRSGAELPGDLISLLHQSVQISLCQSHFSERVPKVQNVFGEGQFFTGSVQKRVQLGHKMAINQRELISVSCWEVRCPSQRESSFLISNITWNSNLMQQEFCFTA